MCSWKEIQILHYTTTLMKRNKQNDTFLCKALGAEWLKLGTRAFIFSISMAQCNHHDLRPEQKVASQLLAQ